MRPSYKIVREYFHYDPDTGILTWLINRRGKFLKGIEAGSLNGEGYREVKINCVSYGVGRIAWLWMTGRWPRKEIDHENRVRDDNRWNNLRQATRSKNCINKTPGRKNKYGFRGLKIQSSGRFQAVIKVKQVEYYCGVYDTSEEAALAYDVAALKYFGEFAVLNFPDRHVS